MSEAEILAEESFEELKELLRWFSHSGPVPTLIGGWAVWLYNSYFGSVDIDIVGAKGAPGRVTITPADRPA